MPDWMRYAAVAAAVVPVAILARKAIRLRRAYLARPADETDVYARLRASAEAVCGVVAGNLLAYEMAVFHHLLFGWRAAPENRPRTFSYHRSNAYLPIVGAVMLVAIAELGGMHLLISLWSPTVAWIVTGVSVYALLWLIGDAHAIRLRPIRVSDDTLRIRVGLRSTIDVPLAAIATVDDAEMGSPARRTPGYLKSVILGAPNLRIVLSTPVDALGPYGLTMEARTIDLRVDDPARLKAELQESIEQKRDLPG